MTTESAPKTWARDVGFTFVVVVCLGLFLTAILLVNLAQDWAEARWPWYGRVAWAAFIALLGAKVIWRLVGQNPPLPARKYLVAGVVAVGLVVIYLGSVRPFLKDRERDKAFAARIAERRAYADGIEAAGQELPDPATVDAAEVPGILVRAHVRLGQVPDLDPDSLDREEFKKFTPAQRGELLKEVDRAVSAMQAFRERHAALREVFVKERVGSGKK
jgi:hypothetical protein